MNEQNREEARKEFFATIPEELKEVVGEQILKMVETAFDSGWISCAKTVMKAI